MSVKLMVIVIIVFFKALS